MRRDHGAEAERLVEALCCVPLGAWRDAARAAGSGRASSAAPALAAAAHSCNPLQAWRVRDTLETALFRLDANDARGLVPDPGERERMRATARRAVSALLCAATLAPADIDALAGPFLGLL